MIADLPSPATPPGSDRVEDREVHAGVAHPADVVAGGEGKRAGAVDDAADPHAFLRRDADGVDEAAAVGIGLPDVGLEKDLAARAGDRLQHRRTSLRAAEDQPYA